METTRQQKMARLLQKELGELLEKEMRGTFQGALITVTKVNVSKDLSIARFYISIFKVGDRRAGDNIPNRGVIRVPAYLRYIGCF